MKRIVLAAALIVATGGCGEHLGAYRAEDVRLVSTIPPAALDGVEVPYKEYLRIELSSPKSLYAAETGGGLYTEADFCPLRNRYQMVGFGPVSTQGRRVESWAGGQAPSRRSRDGRFHYFVYIVPQSAARKPYPNADETLPAYDLRRQRRDICLRFFAPGYNIIPSRSDTVRIPADSIAAALRRREEPGTIAAGGVMKDRPSSADEGALDSRLYQE